LLRRTIRLADGREPRDTGRSSAVREQVESVGQATLTQLDSALADVQESLDEQSNGEAAALLDDARDLQRQIRSQLSDADQNQDTDDTESDGFDSDPVDIDVDAELRTLKDNLEDDQSDEGDTSTGSGEETGDDTGSDDAGDDTDSEDDTGDDDDPTEGVS